MKKRNKKWFALIALLLFTAVFSSLLFVVISMYLENGQHLYRTEKKIQAMNFVAEWLELTRGYFMTKQNQNRIGAWNTNLLPLSWKYIVWYNGNYTLTPGEKEVIELDDPYVVDYIRTVEIKQWDNQNEKKITVTVDYGEKNKVSYETTLVNLYWE